LDQICFQCEKGKVVNARMSGPASVSISAAAGNLYQHVCLPPHDVSRYLHGCDSKLVEIDAHACGTLRRNRPGWKVLEQDIHLVDLDLILRRDLLGGLIHEYELAA
jgi:hypothetical protein